MSKPRIMMVDDEANVLSAYRRSIGRTFELSTFERGADALAELNNNTTYPVIVTDMRMPEMDGLQFVNEARKLTKQSVFVMLTGNADQQTAIDAINKGEVFRFLNKPCDGDLLTSTINTCLRQYELQRAEQELLRDTLTGSVRLMHELIAITNPLIAERSKRVRSIAVALLKQLGQPGETMVSLAGSFSCIGLLPLQVTDESKGDPDEKTLADAAGVGMRLLAKIPRLETVSKIVGNQRAVGQLPDELKSDTLVDFGGKLLRFALDWDAQASSRDGDYPAGLQYLEASLSDIYDKRLLVSASAIVDSGMFAQRISQRTMLTIEPQAIRSGDVLQESLVTKEGKLLLSKDSEVTETTVERIRAFAKSGLLANSAFEVSREMKGDQRVVA